MNFIRSHRNGNSEKKSKTEEVNMKELKEENEQLKTKIKELEKRLSGHHVCHIHGNDVTDGQSSFSHINSNGKDTDRDDADSSLERSEVDSCDCLSGSSEKIKAELECKMREREAELMITIQELREKIRELQTLQSNREPEDTSVEMQQLQEELIACKLREAEANLSAKELQQKVQELERQWQQYLETSCSRADNNKTSKTKTQQELKDIIMTMKLQETNLTIEMNELKQKLMELETKNHIYDRQNKRQLLDLEKLNERLGEEETKERELTSCIRQLEHKIADLESKNKEDLVMSRISDAEYSQKLEEMRRRIAELEITNQELLTSAQLRQKDEDNRELVRGISDPHDEVHQLLIADRLQNKVEDCGISELHDELLRLKSSDICDPLTSSMFLSLSQYDNPGELLLSTVPPTGTADHNSAE